MFWLSLTVKFYFLVIVRLLIEQNYKTAVGGSLLEVPENRTVEIGEEVLFKCRTLSSKSVDWQFVRNDKTTVNVFTGSIGGGGQKTNGYRTKEWIHVQVNVSEGRYDLIIKNVSKAEEGTYICSDISDPSTAANASLVIASKGRDTEEAGAAEMCRYDAAVLAGDDYTLSFQTSSTDSIHLEHRTVARNYPLHVYRDGRLVNDYYVLSGRFQEHVDSVSGTWNLIITNVQMEDAGTYIFSEDNGLGKQQSKEVIVVKKREAGNMRDSENNCTVFYSGHCPPKLEWRHLANESDINPKLLSGNRTVHHGSNAVSVVLDESIEVLQHLTPVCLIMTHPESSKDYPSHIKIQQHSFSPLHLAHFQREEEEDHSFPLTACVTGILLFLLLAIGVCLFIFLKSKKMRKSAEDKREQFIRFLNNLWQFVKTLKNSDDEKKQSSIIETPQHTKIPLATAVQVTPKVKWDDLERGSTRRRTPQIQSAEKLMLEKENTNTMVSEKRTYRNSKRNLSDSMKDL